MSEHFRIPIAHFRIPIVPTHFSFISETQSQINWKLNNNKYYIEKYLERNNISIIIILFETAVFKSRSFGVLLKPFYVVSFKK
jgi:hypothetical protein